MEEIGFWKGFVSKWMKGMEGMDNTSSNIQNSTSGMVGLYVIPDATRSRSGIHWIPAYAGMTKQLF